MAITVVGVASFADDNDANPVITVPGGVTQDDLLVLTGGFDIASSTTPGPITGGFTSSSSINTQVKASFHYKFVGVSPDATITCQGASLGGGDASAAYSLTVLRGVHMVSPLNVATTTATGNSTNPNPAAITTVTNGCMIVVAAVQAASELSVTPPTGFTNGTVDDQSDGDSAATSAQASLLQVSLGLIDPASWTSWGSGPWGAFTIAFDPASAPDVNARSFGVLIG